MTLPSKAEIPAKASNFLRQVIERDLEAGTYSSRRFAGTPGDAAHHAAGPLDPARIRAFGLMISERQAGPFRLELATLHAA
jgi:glutaminyl-tRNA synthetase